MLSNEQIKKMKKAGYKINVFELEILNRLEGKDTIRIYPIYVTGSGRYSQYAGNMNKYANACIGLGLKYQLGNSSARGGQLGQYIDIKKPRKNSTLGKIFFEKPEEGK